MVSGEQAIVNQLCKLVNEFTEVKKLLRASEDRIIDVFYVTVPEAGGTRNFSVGITKIDFKTGAITNPDGTIDTLTRRLDLTQEKDFMHSISIHSNCDVKFRLDSAGQQTIDAQFLFQLPYVTYTTLEIECTATTEISIFACTNPQATLGNFKVSDMTQQTILGDGVELDTFDSITSLLSNLNRIRYQIKILSGEANWDDAPGTDLSSVAGDISTHAAESIDVHGVGGGNSVASDADISTHEADTSVHGAAEVADVATVSAEIDGDISIHAAVSTNVHGVGAGNSVASDDDIATHAAVATNVHGVGVGNSVVSSADIAMMCKIAADSYVGNNGVNRAIPHGFSDVGHLIYITAYGGTYQWLVSGGNIMFFNAANNVLSFAVTAPDGTNFYVGNSGSYGQSANASGVTYTWAVII